MDGDTSNPYLHPSRTHTVQFFRELHYAPGSTTKHCFVGRTEANPVEDSLQLMLTETIDDEQAESYTTELQPLSTGSVPHIVHIV